MKSERRHDLQSNELAHTLGTGIEKVQPFTQYIVGGVSSRGAPRRRMGRLHQFFAKKKCCCGLDGILLSRSIRAMQNRSKRLRRTIPGSAAAIWAEQTAGDEYLADGIDALYKDRGQGVELLKKAIDQLRSGEKQVTRTLKLASACRVRYGPST